MAEAPSTRRPRVPARVCFLLALAGIVGAAYSSENTRTQAAQDRPDEHTRRALLAAGDAGDADALAAAALLTDKSDPAGRLALASRAAAAAPQRPDLAWLQLQQCVAIAACDVEPIEARLRQLDPGNGAAWSGSLARSVSDAARLASVRAAIAASKRFDLYWNALIVHTADALMRSGGMPSSNSLAAALGLGAAQAIPAFQPLTAGCKGAALEPPEALAQCRQLSAVLRRGDTIITESLGLSVAKRLWPVGSPEYQEVVDARRVARYRWQTAAKAGLDLHSEDSAGSQRYLELLATHRTEQEVVLAELTRAGLPLNPGPDWKDRWESSN